MTLYPQQDTFVRGELSPRLHARASLDLYRAGLSLCENFVTLPHGGLRRRASSYFAGEVKFSSKATRLVPFIFSADQAYCLEVGDQYLRIYAYGARVGSIEIATPWPEAVLDALSYYQSADQMWIAHRDYQTQVLTRAGHMAWTLAPFTIDDGPYDLEDTQGTVLAPDSDGRLAVGGTATSSLGTAGAAFDGVKTTPIQISNTGDGFLRYHRPTPAKADAYWITSSPFNTSSNDMFTEWEFQGSNDGINWTTLDSRVGEMGWGNSETRYFDFANDVAYTYHQLNFRGGGGADATYTDIAELAIHQKATDQTPFNLTASSAAGINAGAGFLSTDVGRAIRLLGSDNRWRWARVISRISSTVVTVQLYGHALPDKSGIAHWQLGTFTSGHYGETVFVFEERLSFTRRFSAFLSKQFLFDGFGAGEKADDALIFRNAGGGQANDILWQAEMDGYLILATAGELRALSGSGIDEALTPTSFKNRRSRTIGAAPMQPVEAGASLLYVTRGKRSIAEILNNNGRLVAEDAAQISEHITKRGITSIAFQNDPDPIAWFALADGQMGGYTHQPSQEVRGMHRHLMGGDFQSDWGVVEQVAVTPSQNGPDDVWLIVKRTINGQTKRYIEVMSGAFEYGVVMDAFCVDCGLTYEGAPAGTFSGLGHLEGQTVAALADSVVYTGLTVTGGSVTLPGGAVASKAHIGLLPLCAADTLELDVGGRDGSLMGRRKKVSRLILSLLETDITGLRIQSKMRGSWEPVRIPSVVEATSEVSLYSGNVEVPIDDSWEGRGMVRIRHIHPTPCTIRAVTPVFDSEP